VVSNQEMQLCQRPNKPRPTPSSADHRTWALVVALLACIAIGFVAESTASGPASSPQIRFGVCQREGEKLVGQQPVRVGGKVRAPRKLHNVSPRYPEFPPGTTGRGNWAGEALIDTKGSVVRVWTIREVEITPQLPAFNGAIVDAIRQWRFEPFRVNQKPVPGCLTVTVNINWS
jgi:hypothetical protein